MNTPNSNSVRNTIDLVLPNHVIRIDVTALEPLKKANELNAAFFQAGRDEAYAKAEVDKAKFALEKAQFAQGKARVHLGEVEKGKTQWADWEEKQEKHFVGLAERNGINVEILRVLTMATDAWAEHMERRKQAENQWQKYEQRFAVAEADVKAAELAVEMAENTVVACHDALLKARAAWQKEVKKVEKAVLKQ